MWFFCSNYALYQQALLYVDVVVEIVQTIPGQNGNDDTGHYGNGTSKKNSLPFCPPNIKKTLQDVQLLSRVNYYTISTVVGLLP